MAISFPGNANRGVLPWRKAQTNTDPKRTGKTTLNRILDQLDLKNGKKEPVGKITMMRERESALKKSHQHCSVRRCGCE